MNGQVEDVSDLMNHQKADTMLIPSGIHFSTHAQMNDMLHFWGPDTVLLLIYFMPLLVTKTFLFYQEKVYRIFLLKDGCMINGIARSHRGCPKGKVCWSWKEDLLTPSQLKRGCLGLLLSIMQRVLIPLLLLIGY